MAARGRYSCLSRRVVPKRSAARCPSLRYRRGSGGQPCSSTPLDARVDGQAARRGLIPRVPDGERLLADAEAWLTAELRRPRAHARACRRRAEGEAAARRSIAPSGRPTAGRSTATDAGRVDVVGRDRRARPRLPPRSSVACSSAWSRTSRSIEVGVDPDDPDEVDGGDRPSPTAPVVERAYLGWLGRDARSGARGALAAAVARRSSSALPDGHALHRSTARSRRRSGRATTPGSTRPIADPGVAVDVTPWWADATDGALPA